MIREEELQRESLLPWAGEYICAFDVIIFEITRKPAKFESLLSLFMDTRKCIFQGYLSNFVYILLCTRIFGFSFSPKIIIIIIYNREVMIADRTKGDFHTGREPIV